MIVLVKKLTGKVINDIKGSVNIGNLGETTFGHEDWFKVGALEVFLQNFKKVTEKTDLNKTSGIGLTFNNQKEFIKKEISY
tara:strand:+ start:223 stop:465 length:243 start_codon:yes stop_codon:yes gene_type:complete